MPLRVFAVMIALVATAAVACTGDDTPGSSSDNVDCSPGAAVDVTGLEQEGGLLHVDVRYSGGCAEHRFRVLWNGSYGTSYPPQALILLTHDDGGDTCEAIVNDRVTIDISDLNGPGGTTDLGVGVNGEGTSESIRLTTYGAEPADGDGLPLELGCEY